MEGKTILLFMIFLHTYTADNDEDGDGRNKAEITQEIDGDSEMSDYQPYEYWTSSDLSDTMNSDAGSGLLYQFNENWTSSDYLDTGNLFGGNDSKENSGYYPVWNSGPVDTQPVKCTDLNAKKDNCTELLNETFRISNDAVLFLKGSLLTRVMPSFYIFLFIISLPLNALALLTFTCKIKEKKPAVIFMSNLACVDLLFTLLLPLKIHYHLNGSHWVFGEAACRVLTSAFYCYMYCSILLMMCMSVDRLMAVVFPVASLTWRNKRNSVYLCALVWLMAFAGTTPLLSITQTLKTMNVGVTCHDVMRRNDPADHTYEYLFSILSCLYFFLPLVIILACYCTIIYSLSGKSGRLATSSSSTSYRRRRAVIMIIAVLIEFVVCFAPTNVILLYHCVLLATGSVDGEVTTSYTAYILALCAGCSSVFLDPLLYYYGSSHYRQQIRSVLRWRRTERATKISSTQAHVSV